MIKVQIVERDGARLFEVLKEAMRTGELRTFELHKRGKKVTHTAKDYHGWMNWDYQMGVITCEILSPQKGDEWKILGSLVGRLADRYSELVHNVSIQFEAAPKAMAKRAAR
jgi:hypothetical protein